mmetsp:Transcript_6060/g.14750  ORF Transcript_6060/g.14750 Transcript_6060/m.14750 type:complete len:240 (+) Transcript_6060:1832-2551(+)
MFLLIFPFSTGTFLFDQTYPTRERKRKRFRNTNFPPTIGPFFSLSPFSHALAPTHPFLEMGSHGGGHIFVVQRLSPSGIEARGHGETERGEERKCRVFPPCAGSLSPCISSFFFQFFFFSFSRDKKKRFVWLEPVPIFFSSVLLSPSRYVFVVFSASMSLKSKGRKVDSTEKDCITLRSPGSLRISIRFLSTSRSVPSPTGKAPGTLLLSPSSYRGRVVPIGHTGGPRAYSTCFDQTIS